MSARLAFRAAGGAGGGEGGVCGGASVGVVGEAVREAVGAAKRKLEMAGGCFSCRLNISIKFMPHVANA